MERGMANNWSVHYSGINRCWQWSAYGPAGMTIGSAKSEAEAKAAAQGQAEWLSEPVGPTYG